MVKNVVDADPGNSQPVGEARLPPGPRGSLVPTLQLLRNPRAAIERWVKEYGDPFLLRALNGPVLVTGREDLIRTIHGLDPSIYSPFATTTVVPILGAGSMLVMSGETHRRERRLVTPMFHGERVKAFGASMQQCALDRFRDAPQKHNLNTLQLMTDISLEVIVRTIFGGSDDELANRMMAASRKVVASASPFLFFTSKSQFSFFGLSPWDRWRRAKEELQALLNQIIETRQRANVPSDDILSLLCSATYEDGEPISREHIYSELITFLFAGHETTALTLTWAMYHLHRTPEALTSLLNELQSLDSGTPDELSTAPYLKATVQETLRINPIVTENLRKLNSPMKLGEHLLPAGMGLAPTAVLAHYNPKVYEDPDDFKPERFLGRTYSPFQYMPFGGGHRRCIGAAFASFEIAIVLGTLLKEFRFELVDKQPVVPKRRNVTMGPSTCVPLRYLGER